MARPYHPDPRGYMDHQGSQLASQLPLGRELPSRTYPTQKNQTMSRLLKIKVTPVLSMVQREAAEALGGLSVLRDLERNWGLIPWDANPTIKRYRVTAIEEAMARAEQQVFLSQRERKPSTPPSSPQSAAAE